MLKKNNHFWRLPFITLNFTAQSFSFHLSYHKGAQLFDGNTIMIEARHGSLICAYSQMTIYTALHDAHFGVYSELWLTSDGEVPTYSWFIWCLRKSLDNKVGGHSLRSGGATALALAGVNDDSIQVMGHWASDTFRIYIRKHLVILHALIHNKLAFSHTPSWSITFSTTILPSTSFSSLGLFTVST